MIDRIELGDRLLVIFDGHCGFCNRSVRWLLKRDTHDRLRFAASQSPRVAALLAGHGFTPSDLETGPNTILVLRDAGGPSERVLVRSEAAVAMLVELPRPWPAVGRVLSWIPRPARSRLSAHRALALPHLGPAHDLFSAHAKRARALPVNRSCKSQSKPPRCC